MASSAKPVDSLAALDSDGSPRHLVVDALNLLGSYFLADDHGASKGDAWTMLAVMRRRVAGFLEACASTTPTLMPHFVIDAGWQSEEAATKWRKRREKEVRARRRDIPLSADTFLADALRAAGAKVYQVEGEDGDDIVAVLANALGATSLILSADRDMFRYDDAVLPDAPRRVAAAFSFAEVGFVAGKGKNRAPRFGVALHASPTKEPKDGVARRGAGDMPRFDPARDFERWSAPHDKLRTVVDDPRRGYVRGACSPQTRAFGNLHGHSRPLRLAAYRLMGAEGRVHERFPEWDDATDDVRWEDVDVDVDGGANVASERRAPTSAEDVRASFDGATETEALASAASDSAAETRIVETFLRDADGTYAAHVSALRWLRSRDPAWRAASARGEDDANSFRGFARFAIVAECFAAVSRGGDETGSALDIALAMRELEEAETASAATPRLRGAETSRREREGVARKTREIDAQFAFPPASHRSSRCTERACGALFVVSTGERAFLNDRGLTLPTRCKPCRDARKTAREKQNRAAVEGDAGGAACRRGRGRGAPIASPEPSATFSSPGPSLGTRVGVRPPRTLKAPSSIAPPRAEPSTAAETAKRLAALAVSRGEAGSDA